MRIIMSFFKVSFSVLFISSLAYSNVSLRNGNFFVGYTDMLYSGGFEPKVERVYNSKTQYYGIFGHRWGSAFEVKLNISADGSIVVYEYGGGAKNRFVPVGFSKKDLDEAIDKLAAAAKKTGSMRSAPQEKEYKEKLFKDAVFRENEWQKYVQQDHVKPKTVKDGTQFTSNRFNYQYITKVKKGYIRVFDSGKKENFDNSGKLIKLEDKNGNYVEFTYDKSGLLSVLKDNMNRKMMFKFNTKGLLEKVEGQSGMISTYKYDDKNMLIESKDAESNVYKYDYNRDRNLTKVTYKDKSSMSIAYHDAKLNYNVSSVKDREGRLTSYDYKLNANGADSLRVSVKVANKDKKVISTAIYDYSFKYKSSGEEWIYKMVSNLDGQVTSNVYNEQFGLPVEIVKGKQKTSFKYDKKGRVVEKDTVEELSQMKYDERFGKITDVKRFTKKAGKVTSKKPNVWSQFSYDKSGNLEKAANSSGKKVQLNYDKIGRIRSMVDQDKRAITFKYNENSKPIEIRDSKLGAIKVSYTNTGEIQKVDSDAGRKVAFEVTSAFQNLLEIIRPAGVTLSF